MQKQSEKSPSRLALFYKHTSSADRMVVYEDVMRQAAAAQQEIIDKANAIRAAAKDSAV